MYTRDEMKELLTERDKLPMNDEYFDEIIWGKMLELLQSREDLDKFAEYMDTEMSHDEFMCYASRKYNKTQLKLQRPYPNFNYLNLS